MQWHDLQRLLPRFDEYGTAAEEDKQKIVRDMVQSNPNIIAHYIHLRTTLFQNVVLKPFLGYEDFWYRIEFQMRGTGHCHGVYWVPHHIPDEDNPGSSQDGAPGLRR